MTNDVIARLAAANPVPGPAPRRYPLRMRRPAIALAVAAAVALPTVAFAGRLADALGISNEGTPVSTTSVLPGQDRLDEALQEMHVGPTMQFLGTLNGVAFYATRKADGHFCLAIDHVSEPYEKGVFCDLNADNFPSADVQALTFPRRLQGVAADGVAKVEALDANGDVIDSTPVANNLFVSDKQLPDGAATAIVTLDEQGNVTSRRRLP
jgi:hypothetical protein